MEFGGDHMAQAAAKPDPRRAPREAVDCATRAWSSRLAPAPVQIVNISPYGCMLRGPQPVRIGERVTVDIPGVGERRGLVIWTLGERSGIEFESAIALQPYLDMLSATGAGR